MSSKTKIIVLHMKEVVYTTVFLALAILLLVVFLIMFGSGKKESAKKPAASSTGSARVHATFPASIPPQFLSVTRPSIYRSMSSRTALPQSQ